DPWPQSGGLDPTARQRVDPLVEVVQPEAAEVPESQDGADEGQGRDGNGLAAARRGEVHGEDSSRSARRSHGGPRGTPDGRRRASAPLPCPWKIAARQANYGHAPHRYPDARPRPRPGPPRAPRAAPGRAPPARPRGPEAGVPLGTGARGDRRGAGASP